MNFNKLFEQLVETVEKKRFMGTCANVLDDPEFQDKIAADTTELAQLVENGELITKDDFLALTVGHSNIILQKLEKDITNGFLEGEEGIEEAKYLYYYNYDKDIVWLYDADEDVEYFYV